MIKVKEKMTPKMLKGLASLKADEQDYGVLFYFTEHTFETFDECKSHWEEEDLEDFAVALSETMKAIQPKLDKFNQLNEKLSI